MIKTIEKYCSVVSLFLMAGTALIIAEGPVAHWFAESVLSPTTTATGETKADGTAAPASASAIDGVDAKGRSEIVKRTCNVAGAKSVVHANGSVTTTDKSGPAHL
jgi:hypothetical protein